jgi:indolepyruvate ferredoxin oxidoreductase
LSVTPIETEFGRKRVIDQSSCNKDFSCLKGFCPSFVTVEGGSLKKRGAGDSGEEGLPALPEPALPALDEPYGILVSGVGGTGVVTIGALLGMAAHLEGKGVTVLDQIGMAQKGGAVLSHVRIAASPETIHAVRIANGDARLLVGCDLVVSASGEAISKLRPGRTTAIVNSHQTITGDFTRSPDLAFPEQQLNRAVAAAVGQGGVEFLDATGMATGLLGDSLATNLFMLGFAYQRGLVPVSAEAIDRAIELNGQAIDFNRRGFRWGRRAALDRDLVAARAASAQTVAESHHLAETLDEAVARRVDYLIRYQNAGYAARYADWVARVRAAETAVLPGATTLADMVARALFKAMAYKDEYEVARLHSDGDFARRVAEQFEGDYTLKFHLAPPLVAERDAVTGHLKKREYGAWMLTAFRLLARLKFLRGTALDVFGRTEERRAERRAITEYETQLGEIVAGLTAANHAAAVALAALPLDIRGFGHVKEANRQRAAAREPALVARFRDPSETPAIAAE